VPRCVFPDRTQRAPSFSVRGARAGYLVCPLNSHLYYHCTKAA
jgi:hypothetical protein